MHRDPTANMAMSYFVREERKRLPVVQEARRKYGTAYASEDEVRRFVEMVERLPGCRGNGGWSHPANCALAHLHGEAGRL